MTTVVDSRLLSPLLADLNEEAVLALVQQQLAAGASPLELIEACHAGMRLVGGRYERGEYFISGLIMSGEIFREVVELVRPQLQPLGRSRAAGRVLLGTVSGDIHDIGKNMAAMLLECYGFSVVDLGVDVPAETFAAQAVELRPDVVGLSGLITASFEAMRATVTRLRTVAAQNDLSFAIVIGGGQIDAQVAAHIGADYWVTDAMYGVRLCQQVMDQAIQIRTA